MDRTGQAYEIRIVGSHVPVEVIGAVGDLVDVAEPPTTVLVCHLQDHAQLHGLLARLALLDLEIVEVRPLPPTSFLRDGEGHPAAGPAAGVQAPGGGARPPG